MSNVFDKPVIEWTDSEIRTTLAAIAQRREELLLIAAVVADERDRRARLYAEVTDAVLGIGNGVIRPGG